MQKSKLKQKKISTSFINMGLSYWLPVKENILGVAVSKEGHADNLLGHKGTHQYQFPRKSCSSKHYFQLPTS